jgi:hypothetical protein
VPDARYLRSQAELCLQMAEQISARKDADNLRAMATKYLAQAVAQETGSEQPKLSASKHRDA